MARISRRAAIRAFYDEQNKRKPVTEALKRRIRDQQDRDQRIARALEIYARMGSIAIDHRVH